MFVDKHDERMGKERMMNKRRIMIKKATANILKLNVVNHSLLLFYIIFEKYQLINLNKIFNILYL